MKPLILLVEDEPLLNLSISESLEDLGFAVVSCYSGVEALRLLEEQNKEFDCMITDIRLGRGPTGWDVASRLRQLSVDTAIVYMSGDSSADWAQYGVKDSQMLQKPIALDQLTSAVTAAIPKILPVSN